MTLAVLDGAIPAIEVPSPGGINSDDVDRGSPTTEGARPPDDVLIDGEEERLLPFSGRRIELDSFSRPAEFVEDVTGGDTGIAVVDEVICKPLLLAEEGVLIPLPSVRRPISRVSTE